jgi:hypothetical protein
VQEGTPALIARQPGTDYVAKLVGLNLYAGRADGDRGGAQRGRDLRDPGPRPAR